MMQRVINFSGEKTSAYMTILEYKAGDIVLFQDTGREHPKTYKFINDFEAFEQIPIIRIKMVNTSDPFRSLLEKKGFKVIPNMKKRICTAELKIATAKRYLRSIGVRRFENFLGFRSDEPNRVLNRKAAFKNVIDKFPLYEKGINKAMVNDFWSKKKYNLEIPSILGNCTLCFMKGESAIMAILREFPELATPWIEDEEISKSMFKNSGSGRRYFKHVTMRQLRDIAQNNLFKKYPLEDIKPQFTCTCNGL